MEQLEGHFNDAYSLFQAELAELVNGVKEHAKLVADLRLPNKDLLYQNLRESYASAVGTCNSQSALVKAYLSRILSVLEIKKNEPFRRLTLQSLFLEDDQSDIPESGLMIFFKVIISAGAGISAMTGKNAFDQACLLIDKHNEHSDNFAIELAESRSALESDAVSEVLADLRIKLSFIADTDKELNDAVADRGDLESKISELQKSIRHHRFLSSSPSA